MIKLFLIGGTMGIGKTSVCERLNIELPNSVFLDGDWCWYANPFRVTDKTRAMVIDNICHVLNNFIHCAAYDHIIFCWVMHEQSIIDKIISGLDIAACNVINISLMVNEINLKNRLMEDVSKGIRSDDIIKRSMDRIPLYEKLNTIKIDTNNKTIQMIADEIKKL